MKHSRFNWLFITCISLSIVSFVSTMTSCAEQQKEPPEEIQELLNQTEALRARQEEIKAELKRMSVSEIVTQLEKESSLQVEPFNSIAYEELVSRGEKVAQEVKRLITNKDRTSLLSLLALREIDSETYNTLDINLRIQILVDSLSTSEYFNIWGIPHLYWEPAAIAIIENGEAAVDALKPLLQDKRPAPLWGSEEVLEYQKYQYRVSDYAMALINAITKGKIEIPIDPKVRDELLAE